MIRQLLASRVVVGGAIAGGTNTRVLFDDNGVIGESANLTFDKTTSTLTLGGNLSIAPGKNFQVNGYWFIDGNATGVITLHNWANTGFDRLQFGGVTSAFPSLKRSTTILQARLADDSGYASIQGKITTETNYTAGAFVASGYITLYDATGTAYKVGASL